MYVEFTYCTFSLFPKCPKIEWPLAASGITLKRFPGG